MGQVGGGSNKYTVHVWKPDALRDSGNLFMNWVSPPNLAGGSDLGVWEEELALEAWAWISQMRTSLRYSTVAA